MPVSKSSAWKLVKKEKSWVYKGKEFVVGKFSRDSKKANTNKVSKAKPKAKVAKPKTKARKIAQPRRSKIGTTEDIVMSLVQNGDHDSMGPNKRQRTD